MRSGYSRLLGRAGARAQDGGSAGSSGLVAALGLGWHFGSVTMLASGSIACVTFWLRLRGRQAPAWPAGVVAATHVGLAVLGVILRRPDPFFFVFLAPGLLLIVALLGTRGAG